MAELSGVFEASVAQLNSGTPLDACLAMHPAESAELAPLLHIVTGLQRLAEPAPAMDPSAAQSARAGFLARAAALSKPAQVTLEDAFDQSTAMLAANASLEECLDRFPHYAAELRPMLETMVSLASRASSIDTLAGWLSAAARARNAPRAMERATGSGCGTGC